jgi:hypothetical protein
MPTFSAATEISTGQRQETITSGNLPAGLLYEFGYH